MDQVGGIIDIAKCLGDCAKKEAAYIYELEENLKSLEDKWGDLISMKEDLNTRVHEAEKEGKQSEHEINRWLKKVDAIQQEVEVIQVEGAKEVRDKCLSRCCPKNCMSSYKLGTKATKMLNDVGHLEEQGKRFSENFKIAHRRAPGQIEMPMDEVLGLGLFKEVWNSIEDENVGIIGLYGMGGVGKTTLLKKINNEFVKRRLGFDFVIWVEVSKEFNLDGIIEQIRKWIRIGDDVWSQCNTRDEKTAHIHEVLNKKKFVLLLDDIWERVDLTLVGVPHPKGTNFQSKVLFTTRLKDVCEKMQANKKFKVETLTEKEALELFCLKVGEDTLRSDPNIPKLAEKMAKECKNLPLALTVVGSVMAGMKNATVWEYLINNLKHSSWTASDLKTKVFSILKCSYDKLDEVEKCCFLYCALYPEDYEILVPDLVDKWMWEKFLCKDATKTVEAMRGHGESVIEKLKLSCLLESVEDHLFMTRKVKMHHMIREMALWILAHDEHDNNREMMQRTLMMNDWESRAIPNSPNATTLVLLKKDSVHLQCRLKDEYVMKLKVLDLKLEKGSFVDIGGLVSLEYLSLVIGEIPGPDFFNNLQYLANLKFLNLRADTVIDCHIFPLGVLSCIQQLRVYRNTGIRIYSEERRVLEELESLPHIEELWIEIWTEDGLNKLLESTKLQSCMYRLSSQVPYGSNNDMPLSLASVSKMKQLQQIDLSWLNIISEQYSCVSDSLTKLRRVKISLCSITHVTWLKYAPFLQELVIFSCELMEEVIEEEEPVKDENVDSCVFSSLGTLTLMHLPRLKIIHKLPLRFPSLKSIRIFSCPKLNKLPLDSNSAEHKLTLIKGSQNWWDNLEWDDLAAKHKFQSKFKALDSSDIVKDAYIEHWLRTSW